MKMAIILNNKAGSFEAQAKELLEYCGKQCDIDIWPAGPETSGRRLVERASKQGIDTLVAVGGDGTVHHLVNSIRHNLNQFRIGFIPLGTGRTAGGGFEVAPQANPSDSYMNIVVVEEISALQLAEVSARLLTGNYTQSESVLEFKAKTAKIISNPSMLFSIDGELFSGKNPEFKTLPKALRIALNTKELMKAA